jgi:hypothetical protein
MHISRCAQQDALREVPESVRGQDDRRGDDQVLGYGGPGANLLGPGEQETQARQQCRVAASSEAWRWF